MKYKIIEEEKFRRLTIHISTLYDMCPYCLSSLYLNLQNWQKNKPNIKVIVSSIDSYCCSKNDRYSKIITDRIKFNKLELLKKYSFYENRMRALGPFYNSLEVTHYSYIIQFVLNSEIFT